MSHNDFMHRTQQPFHQRDNPIFYHIEKKRMKENLKTLGIELGYWARIERISKEINKLRLDFNDSIDNSTKQAIRDEIQSKDEKRITIADDIMQLQVDAGYHITPSRANCCTEKMVEQQLKNISFFMRNLSIKIGDLTQINRLFNYKQQLNKLLNTCPPYMHHQLRQDIWSQTIQINEIRQKYYLAEGPSPEYNKMFNDRRSHNTSSFHGGMTLTLRYQIGACALSTRAEDPSPEYNKMFDDHRIHNTSSFHGVGRKENQMRSSIISSHNINFARPQHIKGYRSKNRSKIKGDLLTRNRRSAFKSLYSKYKAKNLNFSRKLTCSSLQSFETKNILQNSNLEDLNDRYSPAQSQRLELIGQQEPIGQPHSDSTSKNKFSFENQESTWMSPTVETVDENVEKMMEDYPEFNDQQRTIITEAICGNSFTVLISKFNVSITRDHICTLLPLKWLNDEVINFYMNLLTERSELRSNDGYPKVYALNTFFTQRLCSGGYSAVRRWTNKIDIFAYDIIPVPVHVANNHWCMAIINIKGKTIKYYDSLGSSSHRILSALEQYLKEESLDKRNVEFDFSGWNTENVPDNPRQENASDCGVFSCMIAEFICRNRSIVFNQQHMNYFRQKMILEICTGKLLL